MATVEWVSLERANIIIPYASDKEENLIIKTATDCKGILFNYGQGNGEITKISGEDYTVGVCYNRSHSRLKSLNGPSISINDKVKLTKITGNRVEYENITTIDKLTFEWSIIIQVGCG